MKVLKNNYDKTPITWECICPNCDSELEYETDDLKVGHLGLKYLTCPCCGFDMYDEEFGEEDINKNNLRFPQHYYYYKSGKHIENEEIDKQVRNMINLLENSTDECYRCHAGGDTVIFVFKLDDDNVYNVVVANGYYDTNIPINAED